MNLELSNMVLKADGEMYVAYTTEGAHNQDYCFGPGIFHHIEKDTHSYLDDGYVTSCGEHNSRNFVDGSWRVKPASGIGKNWRLCRKCAKRMGDGKHKINHIDSIFDIPESEYTYFGHPVRRAWRVFDYAPTRLPDIDTVVDFAKKYLTKYGDYSVETPDVLQRQDGKWMLVYFGESDEPRAENIPVVKKRPRYM